MKCIYRTIVAAATLAGLFLSTACDWSSGSQDDFNTSSSDGSNLTGYYEGVLSGGLAVNDSSLGILSFNVQQSGNTLTVIDNFGSVYKGTAGESLSSANNIRSDDGAVSSGTNYYTFNISFEGVNINTGREISFAGFVEVVEESVITFYLYDLAGNVINTVTEDQITNTLKGTWVENGAGASVFAKTNPPAVEPATPAVTP